MLEEERESLRLQTRGNQTGDVRSCCGHLTTTRSGVYLGSHDDEGHLTVLLTSTEVTEEAWHRV